MRIFSGLILAITCLLSACSDSVEDRQREANQYLKSADQLYKQGQLRAALVQAKNVIQLIPDSAQGYLQVTRIYNRIGYYSEVEKLIGSKINTMPELAYPLAYSYYQRKKYRSVLDTLNLTAAPEDPAVNLLRALCHLHLGEDILFEKDLKSLEQEKDNPYLLYARAKSAEARGDLLKAESFLKQILSTAPIYIDAITDLAEIYFKQSRFDAAEQRLTQALAAITNADTLTVEKARVLTMMVEMLVQQGRSSEAYTYQKILATANPELDFMRGRFDEALEFYAEGNIERARSVLIDLHQSFPNNSNVTTLLGVIAFQLGQDEEAETYLSQVIDPETATSSLIYASSLLKTRNNKIDDAITLLKSAVEAQPRNAQLLSTYGLALLQKDPLDKEAVLALEKSIVMDPKQQRLRLALADRHYRLGEVEQGFAQLESAYRQTPLDILIAQNYFRQLKNVSGEKLVLTEIAALKEKFPTEAQARLIEAWWMLESKRYAEVEKLLVKQMDSFAQAEKMSAYLLLADNYAQQNKPEAARKVLEEYLRESPQSLQIYNQWLGLINPDQLPAAFAFLQELQTADETAWQPHFYTGLLKARSGSWDQAIASLDHVLQKTTKTPVRQQILNLYNTRGFQLIQSGDVANAQAAFLKVLGIDANDRTALYYYVQIAMQSNQIPEAKKIIAQADKNTAIYEFLSGLLKENVREHELALKHFRAAWAKEAFDLYAEKLYSIYTTRQDKPAIYALIKEWEKRLPNSSQVILLSAMLEQEDGNQSEAIKRYEKLLGLVPDNVVALNNLAWLYLEVDGNKAETLAKSAADLAPSSVDVLDTYAWALFKNNKLEKALEVIQYASELAPDNAMVREHLDVIQQAARAR